MPLLEAGGTGCRAGTGNCDRGRPDLSGWTFRAAGAGHLEEMRLIGCRAGTRSVNAGARSAGHPEDRKLTSVPAPGTDHRRPEQLVILEEPQMMTMSESGTWPSCRRSRRCSCAG